MWALIWITTSQAAVLGLSTALLLIVVGLVVLIGRSHSTRVDSAEAAHAARQLLDTCRNLDSENAVVRAGGLHALGMMWRDWPREHDRILQIVVSWLQDHAQPTGADTADFRRASRPAPDVAAAVAELAGRPVRDEQRQILDLAGCALSDCDLPAVRLPGANLTKAELNRATLSGADLSGANLSSAQLSGVTLSGANLTGAGLDNSLLEQADLSETDLTGANLKKAGLRGATLAGANLTGANLTAADLSGVDLTEVTGLTHTQLRIAVTDEMTRIPAGARPQD